MRAWLRFLRVPLAPTAAFDVLACHALALTAAGHGLGHTSVMGWVLLGLGAVLLYGFGMGLNDLADRERDSVLAPERPLPSGALGAREATVVVLLLGAGALAIGGGPAGSRAAVGAALLLAALYDLVLKRGVVPGVAAMGGVRFANAATGVVPLVLAGAAPWTALLAPLAIGLYAAAITLWSTTEEVAAPARRVVARALGVVAFAGAGVLPWLLSGRPTLGIVLAGGVVTSLAFARTPKAGPPKRQVLEMLLGLYFLSACLATGADGGSMAASLGAVGLAFLLIWASQRAIFALRPRPS